MNVLVTGGAGFIGSHTTRALAARGDRVTVLDNLSTGKPERLADLGGAVRLVEGDLRDAAAVRRALDGTSHVLHLAALPSVARSVADPLTSNDVNVNGTLRLLDTCRELGVRRVVVASSSSVYGDQPEPGAKHERMAIRPASPYATSKLATECYALAFSRTWSIQAMALRYFNIFGPGQDPDGEYSAVIPRFVAAAFAGAPVTIHGDGEQARDFTYIGNAVEANLLALDAQVSGEAVNVASGASVSVNAMVADVMRLTGCKLDVRHGPARAGDVRASLADLALAGKLLGYRPRVDFAEGLRLTVESFRPGGGRS